MEQTQDSIVDGLGALQSEKRCNWCGHGDRLDRGNVTLLTDEEVQSAGYALIQKDAWFMHYGCLCQAVESHNRTLARINRVRANI